MKKILLPTDFSENAWNAIKYAVRLFRYENCRFYLLNTYTPVVYDTEFLLYSLPQAGTNIFENNSVESLEELEKRIKDKWPASEHRFELISSLNSLTEEIKELVKEKEIDLIVMGTKGATGAKEILFGSNTVQVINKVDCAVLAVPSQYSFRVPRDILFPTDLEKDFSKDPPKLVKEIALSYQPGIHLMNVSFGDPLTDFQEKQKRFLQVYFHKVPTRFHRISDKSVSGAIYEFQQKIPVDLLVMANNKHSFFENLIFRPVINEIGFHVKIPFLVLPAVKESSEAKKGTEESTDYNSRQTNDSLI